MRNTSRLLIGLIAVLPLLGPPSRAQTSDQPGPQLGRASWYGGRHVGRPTASGEIFTSHLRTAAHRDLPLGSWVRVINLQNQRSVLVRINDRGPFIGDRVIDLSERAARDLDMVDQGIAEVRLERVAGP